MKRGTLRPRKMTRKTPIDSKFIPRAELIAYDEKKTGILSLFGNSDSYGR